MQRYVTLLAIWFLLLSGRSLPAKNPETPEKAASEPAAAAPSAAIERLTESARKSVVIITFEGRDGRRQGLGSGFVVSADGLIATNHHVISEARPITVTLADGKDYPVTSIHASNRSLDLAVLRIEAKDLSALPLGDSDSLKQGQAVVAIGNPYGLKLSVVSGVVSGVRELEGRPMIQLAIPIEPGNSGGPLLDLEGRVQGILTMKSLITPNLGFALAANALKPLLDKPNPIPMARWLTIGTLDPQQWKPLFGANWRRRSGRLVVEGVGQGFGGRSLCLWQQKLPERPFECAVAVKLGDEKGAAGLAFCADGEHKHYGFYPTAGKLRLTRFDGPDVLSWKILFDEPSEHYVSGDWNTLRVRLDEGKIQCYVNDHLVVESADQGLSGGQLGLAKFRETQAEFKNFHVATKIAATTPTPDETTRIGKLVESLSPSAAPGAELLKNLTTAPASTTVLRERAKLLDQQAVQLRQLAAEVHQARVIASIVKAMEEPEEKIDLVHAALLIAQLDNEEVDVEYYRQEVARMAGEVKAKLPAEADDAARRDALRKYLFEENGFHGSRGDYYNQANSYLNEVLDDREGLPITLSVLYMELARQIDLNVVGVGFPGHFIVQQVPEKGDPQWIDVYEDGQSLTRADLEKRALEQAGRALTDADLSVSSKRAIVTRMLGNLLGIARSSRDGAGMLRYLDAIVAVAPDSGPERWVRAVLRYGNHRPQSAREDLDWLLEHKPPGVDLGPVEELQQLIEGAAK